MPYKYLVDVTELGDDQWRVEKDFTVQSHGFKIIIPAGFQTDLASIPRSVWWAIAPFELSLAAPILHDWLYRHGGKTLSYSWSFSRADADAFLEDVMEQEGVSKWRRFAAYHAVRLFGGSSWQSSPITTLHSI